MAACYWTGQRTGFLTHLRWDHVDMERGTIMATKTKTGRSVAVPISEPLLAILRALPRASAGWVFPNPGTGHPWTNLRKPWRTLIAAANALLPPAEQIPRGQRLYSLRHSRISHLLAAGVPPQVVAQAAGNSLRMLERHYAHLTSNVLQTAIAQAAGHPALRPVAVTKTVTNTRHKTGHRVLRDVPPQPN